MLVVPICLTFSSSRSVHSSHFSKQGSGSQAWETPVRILPKHSRIQWLCSLYPGSASERLRFSEVGIILKLDDDYSIIISFLLLPKIIPGSCWGRKWATKGSQKHLHDNQSSKGTYIYRNFVIPVKNSSILISLQSSWDLLHSLQVQRKQQGTAERPTQNGCSLLPISK